MQKVTRVVALLFVALAILLAIVAFSLGRRANSPVPPPVTTTGQAKSPQIIGVPVVLAAAGLPAGEPISPSALRVANWPQRPAGAYGDINALAGDIPLRDLPAGTPITANLLAHGVAMQLKSGERALAVPVDEIAGAGNRVAPGDYVDVFMSLKLPASPNLARPATQAQDDTQMRLLLSRLRVLAYGARDLPQLDRDGASSQPATASSAESRSNFLGARAVHQVDSNSTIASARTAVLAVPIEEVGRLLLGAQSGKLFLALRHPTDPGLPDDNLFPQPQSVLSPLPGLSADQHQALASPENHAFAGIDVNALSGRDNVPKPIIRRTSNAPASLEIIRGDQQAATRNSRSTSL